MTAFVWPVAVVAVTLTICWTALRAWRSWLDLKRYQTDLHEPTPAARIEMANLKERLRKLEAIATGVDL